MFCRSQSTDTPVRLLEGARIIVFNSRISRRLYLSPEKSSKTYVSKVVPRVLCRHHLSIFAKAIDGGCAPGLLPWLDSSIVGLDETITILTVSATCRDPPGNASHFSLE